MADYETNPQLEKVVAEYLQQTRTGPAPDRRQLLRAHPALADELRSFFAAHDRMKAAASSPADEPTLPPVSADDSEATIGSSHPAAATLLPSGSEDLAPVSRARFGAYELQEEIARGGMGVVYKARHCKLNRIVALKMILAGQLASEVDVQRFYTEAEAAANLEHPGIVPIYEIGEHEGQHYFAMAYVEGTSLADRLRERRCDPREAAELMRAVAQAIHHAHQRGVIHRDLKPSNILLDRSGRPRVTDFGLAKRIDAAEGLTASGQILGTPGYMAPEQATGKVRDVGPAADVFSLGAVLFALLTGEAPFRAETALNTILLLLDSEAEAPRRLNPSIPRDLESICLKCLAKDPRDRYGTALELAEDLRRFLNEEATLARPPHLAMRIATWARRRPALAATLIGTLAFYINHLVNVWIVRIPGEGGAFHAFVTGLVLAWIAGAAVFQWCLSRPASHTFGLYGWSVMEVALFTVLLIRADGPLSSLAPGYVVLTAAAILRERTRLIGLVCALCAGGYLFVVWHANVFRPQLSVPMQTVIPFVLCILVTGLLQTLVMRRIRLAHEGPGGESAMTTRT